MNEIRDEIKRIEAILKGVKQSSKCAALEAPDKFFRAEELESLELQKGLVLQQLGACDDFEKGTHITQMFITVNPPFYILVINFVIPCSLSFCCYRRSIPASSKTSPP